MTTDSTRALVERMNASLMDAQDDVTENLCRMRSAASTWPRDVKRLAEQERIATAVESAIAAADQWLSSPTTNQCGETCERAKLCATCARGLQQPEQEPVSDDAIINALLTSGDVVIDRARALQSARAVLALRPARGPLTVARCHQLCAQVDAQQEATAGDYAVDFVRAIERAHGIAGDQP